MAPRPRRLEALTAAHDFIRHLHEQAGLDLVDQEEVMQQKKDVGVAAALGFLFGFFGLAYVMPVGEALAWLGAYIAVSFFTGGIGILAWPLASLIAVHYAQKINEGLNPSLFSSGASSSSVPTPATASTCQCPQCRRGVAADAAFCTGCGFKLQVTCGTCRRTFATGTAFCAYCGAKLI